jgi:hypothetical protein
MNVAISTHRIRRRRWDLLTLILSVLLAGCYSQKAHKPTLQITRVPAADPGGPNQSDYIEGRASGAKPDEQIVLYARSGGIWWVQPFTAQPFTRIQTDSTWKNDTHLGLEYAALLVEPGYRPLSKLATLPKIGNGVVAVTSEKGKFVAPVVQKVIQFSGYDWTVLSIGSSRGGDTNAYDPANAWTDEKGYLHLRMALKSGQWTCAEVDLTRSLGYGTYRFVVQDSAHLEPFAILGIDTWDPVESTNAGNELDIDLGRWGNPTGRNAQYVVQPFYVPENVARFTVLPGVLTHSFRWEPGVASFKTTTGATVGDKEKTVNARVFTSDVPTPAGEKVHIGLYDFHHFKNLEQRPVEVVIEKFEYLP